MTMPLDGIRVLDMTLGQQGPVASMMLADMGADVIKLEDPLIGDPGRYLHAILGVEVPLNFYFENNNRNKRSITVNLKKEKGKEIVYRLAGKSDVFVTNYLRTTVESLGMDYQTISRYNPSIIYAVGSGFGPMGPDHDKACLDIAAQARGGIWSISGEPDQPPVLVGAGMADQVGAGLLAYGIVLALFSRERTGVGQEVDVSLLAGQAWLGALGLQQYLFYSGVQALSRVSRAAAGNPLWSFYRTKDDKWLCLAMLVSDVYWRDFCRTMGIEELEQDPRFESHTARQEHAAELVSILDERFASKTREQWIRRFSEQDRLLERKLIWEPFKDYAELAADPQMYANDYIVEFNHPARGSEKRVGIPVKLSRTPGAIRSPAPELGQHTEEVLLELGYTWQDIEKLRMEGGI